MAESRDRVAEYQSIRDRLHAYAQHAPAEWVERGDADVLDELISEAEQLTRENYSKYKMAPTDFFVRAREVGGGQAVHQGRLAYRIAAFMQLWDRLEKRFLPSLPPGSVVAERNEILTTLIVAYQSVTPRRDFTVLFSDVGLLIKHPGLPNGEFSSAWSEIRALEADGLLNIDFRSGKPASIGLPTRVLDAVERGEQPILQEPSAQDRIRRLASSPTIATLTAHSGGVINAAVNSPNSEQRFASTVTVSESNWDSLRAALEAEGLTETPILSLRQALEEDHAEFGTPSLGPRTIGWLKGLGIHGVAPTSADVAAGLILKFLGIG
jgi:hypothetical protein